MSIKKYSLLKLSFGNKNRLVCILVLCTMSFVSTNSYAWSLRTHIWIAQQILNDVLDDGKLNIGNGTYPLPAYIVQALRSHPKMFRCGALGPDIYPDLVVGQITTHPGVKGGWQTDQWLSH